MQLLESKSHRGFRYRFRWGQKGNLPSHLAATRVAVLQADPHEARKAFAQRIADLSNTPKLQGPAGPLELRELSFRPAFLWSEHLSNVMEAQGVPPSSRRAELEPQLAIARDSVAFHHDMPMWTDVFGVWGLEGPARVLHFPMMGLAVPFEPGTLVLFDPAQPHGLLREGETEFDTSRCIDPQNVACLSFMLPKAPALAEMLGCAPVPCDLTGILETADQYQVCPRTGHVELFGASAPLAA